MIARMCARTVVVLGLAMPAGMAAQEASPIEVGGLLRAGARAHSDSTLGGQGFRLFESRLKVEGAVGLVFDYKFVVRYDASRDAYRIHDAVVTMPVIPEFELSFGMFKPYFGYEATVSRSDITFVERSQAATALRPDRQIGVQAGGQALDGRFTYGAGLYNGNGRSIANDGDDYMFAGRVQYNSIGTIAFYDDLVVQAGASLAYSEDTSAPLGKGIITGDRSAAPGITSDFAGSRLYWGADVQVSYHSLTLTGEYLRADFDLDAPLSGSGSAETEASGGWVQFGYRPWGLLEGVVRYDGFRPALGADRKFMVFGLNLYPDGYARFGLQYATALDDSPHAPTLSDGQFQFLAQVDF
ncbi:porin [Candidatus Palauibacter irciniicola]|uniref:porin n=1 Tax=Candidatus Palauibacter irciniicola TaxID=3056733 RepID=UPI003B01B3BE